MHRRLAGCVVVLAGSFAPSLYAQPGWRPASGPLDAPAVSAPISQTPAASLGRPTRTAADATLGSPAPVEPSEFAADTVRPKEPVAGLGTPRSGVIVRAQRDEPAFPSGKPVSGWVSLGPPESSSPGWATTTPPPPGPAGWVNTDGPRNASSSTSRSPGEEPFPPQPKSRSTRQVRYDDTPEERFNRGVVSGDPLLGGGKPTTSRSSRYGDGNWLPFVNNQTKGCDAGTPHGWFQCDTVFRDFVSPITNPFLFEDPRSLTEVRPLFIFQKVPGSNPLFLGGQQYFFGARASLALTENLSLTLNKIGFNVFRPGDTTYTGTNGGFDEIWLGPKLTFWRDDQENFLAAAGLIFQIPAGSSNVYQDTGKLSLTPYLTAAKNFFGSSSFGGINLIDTAGYSFGLGGGRSDYFYNSFHLDYDVGNQHRIYPLVELNWFHYTKAGGERPVTVEGLDLANLGAVAIDQKDFLSIAGGLRYKFSDQFSMGGAIEFPLLKQHDPFDYRFTVDFIWRY